MFVLSDQVRWKDQLTLKVHHQSKVKLFRFLLYLFLFSAFFSFLSFVLLQNYLRGKIYFGRIPEQTLYSHETFNKHQLLLWPTLLRSKSKETETSHGCETRLLSEKKSSLAPRQKTLQCSSGQFCFWLQVIIRWLCPDSGRQSNNPRSGHFWSPFVDNANKRPPDALLTQKCEHKSPAIVRHVCTQNRAHKARKQPRCQFQDYIQRLLQRLKSPPPCLASPPSFKLSSVSSPPPPCGCHPRRGDILVHTAHKHNMKGQLPCSNTLCSTLSWTSHKKRTLTQCQIIKLCVITCHSQCRLESFTTTKVTATLTTTTCWSFWLGWSPSTHVVQNSDISGTRCYVWLKNRIAINGNFHLPPCPRYMFGRKVSNTWYLEGWWGLFHSHDDDEIHMTRETFHRNRRACENFHWENGYFWRTRTRRRYVRIPHQRKLHNTKNTPVTLFISRQTTPAILQVRFCTKNISACVNREKKAPVSAARLTSHMSHSSGSLWCWRMMCVSNSSTSGNSMGQRSHCCGLGGAWGASCAVSRVLRSGVVWSCGAVLPFMIWAATALPEPCTIWKYNVKLRYRKYPCIMPLFQPKF